MNAILDQLRDAAPGLAPAYRPPATRCSLCAWPPWPPTRSPVPTSPTASTSPVPPPLNDPIGTLVLGSDARNIDAVFIAGQVRKWAGTVVDVDLAALREGVRTSRDRVLHASGHGGSRV